MTHEAQVERILPNPAYFHMVMSSVNIQAMDAKVDNLEIRDGQGNVLYSDIFNSLGAWKAYRGTIGSAGVSGGVAYGYSDWNIFGLTNTPFDSSNGLVVEADVYWAPRVSVYIFYWSNTNPISNLVNTQMLGMGWS
jgi:hypothetical protein